MTVEVIAVGGYEEVGKNMTAVKIGEDVIIFDMGIHLDRISIHEDTDIDRMHSLDLIERGVIPDDTLMKDVDGQVIRIIPGEAGVAISEIVAAEHLIKITGLKIAQ